MARKASAVMVRQELIDMTPDEFTAHVAAHEAEGAQIEAAKPIREKKFAKAIKQAQLADRQAAYDKLQEAMAMLDSTGDLPSRLKEALTSKDGLFTPHRFLKRPR